VDGSWIPELAGKMMKLLLMNGPEIFQNAAMLALKITGLM
jgi:hypothetical protein